MASSTVPDLLADLLRADSARPLITFYDGDTGERTELSVASFENWVAKTANLLQDELDTEPGAHITIWLPTHWLAAVWSCAAAACGARVSYDSAVAGREQIDVVASGPETLEPAVATGAESVVALSLQPLAMRFGGPLPDGVLDYAAEAPAQNDVFHALSPPDGEADFVLGADGVHTQLGVLSQAREQARTLGIDSGGRLLTDANPASGDGLVTGLVAPMVAGGSVVLVRNLGRSAIDELAAPERVTAQAVTGGG